MGDVSAPTLIAGLQWADAEEINLALQKFPAGAEGELHNKVISASNEASDDASWEHEVC